MNKNIIVGLVVVLILIGISSFIFLKQKQTSYLAPEVSQPIPQGPTEIQLPFPPEIPTPPEEFSTPSPSEIPSAIPSETPVSPEFIIRITNAGFEPNLIEVPKGSRVTFINESSNPSWPASAIHPTHRVYPGSGIEKCGTPEQGNIFDACRGLEKGESWSFVFNEIGEWGYHDHLNPSLRGKIIVK